MKSVVVFCIWANRRRAVATGGRFLPILANLALLLAVFRTYRVEGLAFQRLTALSLAALPIHYLLSYQFKKPFFLAVSVVGLWIVFGTQTTLAVVPAAVGLVGLTALPLAWSVRAGLVVSVGVAICVARAFTPALSTFETVWPLLGSMFIFRMMIYLYELKHAKRPERFVDALGYFVLLPNFCFLHFPVVDYRTLQRGYFASNVHDLMRSGVRMMFKGTLQLLMYRLIYHDFEIKPEEVHGFWTLMGHLITTYLKYLHVSGQFHIACGMLHLFGFQLPETHNNYLLATGFTDYWRRINIYWKDFMVRVVFNPVVFRFKHWSRAKAMSAATACVFVVTWALHGLQSFILCGAWGFTLQDALFWGILGVLVMVNVQIDARASRRDRGERRAAPALAVHAAKVAGTFVTITLLWSLWNSSSVGSWLATFRRAFVAE